MVMLEPNLGNYQFYFPIKFAQKIKVFFFGFAIFGYGVISFLVDEASTSRRITVPYRFTVLLLSIVVISLSIKKEMKINKTIDKNHRKLEGAKLYQVFLFLLFLFLSIYSIRLLFDISSVGNILTRTPSDYFLNWIGICLLPGFAFLFLSSKEHKSYLYCSLFFLFVTCLLVLFIDPQSSVAFIQQGRLTNAALDPISLSHVGTSLVLISAFILISKKRNSLLLSLISLAGIFLGCYSLFMGASRGPLLALIVGIILIFVGASKSRMIPLKFLGLMAIVMLFVPIASMIAARLGGLYLYRFVGIFNNNVTVATSDSDRLFYLKSALNLIWHNIIVGYGLEVPKIGYPHNLIVEAFLSTGVFGGIIFTCVYLYSLIKAISLIRNDWERWGWLGLIYMQYAIAAMLSSALYSASSFWYLLFVMMSRRKVN